MKEFIIRFARALQTDTPTLTPGRRDREKMQAIRKHILSHPEQKAITGSQEGHRERV